MLIQFNFLNIVDDSLGVNAEDDASGEEKLQMLSPLREQDRFLPIANVARIMKNSVPKSGKVLSNSFSENL